MTEDRIEDLSLLLSSFGIRRQKTCFKYSQILNTIVYECAFFKQKCTTKVNIIHLTIPETNLGQVKRFRIRGVYQIFRFQKLSVSLHRALDITTHLPPLVVRVFCPIVLLQ